MTSTSRVGESPTTTTSISRRDRARRYAGLLLATGICVASLAILPATAQAAKPVTARSLAQQRSTAHSAASTYCSKLPASTVSHIVGTTVSLFEAIAKGSTLECIHFGTGASVSRPEVVISMQSRIPASQLATRAKAEAKVAGESPKTVKLIFTSLPSVGPPAFAWTYQKSLNGGQIVGVANNKGTTGYGALVGGAAKNFGAAAGHVPAVEKLLALGMAA